MQIIYSAACIGAGAIVGACARPVSTVAPVPQPAPVETKTQAGGQTEPVPPAATPPASVPQVRPNTGLGGPWEFGYRIGTYSYIVSTDAQVTALSESGGTRTLPTTTQRMSVSIGADSVRLVDPVASADAAPACDPAAALASRLTRIIPALPSTLSVGYTWSDSLVIHGCRGSVPLTSTVAQTYTVYGDTTYDGGRALLVRRTEIITATGEGSEGQHRILVSASGTGTADLFFDPAAGRFLGSVSDQTTKLDVTTSGRHGKFTQHVREQVTPAR